MGMAKPGELARIAILTGRTDWLVDAAVVILGANRQRTTFWRAAEMLEHADVTWQQVVERVGHS